jgi:hypothetical protein
MLQALAGWVRAQQFSHQLCHKETVRSRIPLLLPCNAVYTLHSNACDAQQCIAMHCVTAMLLVILHCRQHDSIPPLQVRLLEAAHSSSSFQQKQQVGPNQARKSCVFGAVSFAPETWYLALVCLAAYAACGHACLDACARGMFGCCPHSGYEAAVDAV